MWSFLAVSLARGRLWHAQEYDYTNKIECRQLTTENNEIFFLAVCDSNNNGVLEESEIGYRKVCFKDHSLPQSEFCGMVNSISMSGSIAQPKCDLYPYIEYSDSTNSCDVISSSIERVYTCKADKAEGKCVHDRTHSHRHTYFQDLPINYKTNCSDLTIDNCLFGMNWFQPGTKAAGRSHVCSPYFDVENQSLTCMSACTRETRMKETFPTRYHCEHSNYFCMEDEYGDCVTRDWNQCSDINATEESAREIKGQRVSDVCNGAVFDGDYCYYNSIMGCIVNDNHDSLSISNEVLPRRWLNPDLLGSVVDCFAGSRFHAQCDSNDDGVVTSNEAGRRDPCVGSNVSPLCSLKGKSNIECSDIAVRDAHNSLVILQDDVISVCNADKKTKLQDVISVCNADKKTKLQDFVSPKDQREIQSGDRIKIHERAVKSFTVGFSMNDTFGSGKRDLAVITGKPHRWDVESICFKLGKSHCGSAPICKLWKGAVCVLDPKVGCDKIPNNFIGKNVFETFGEKCEHDPLVVKTNGEYKMDILRYNNNTNISTNIKPDTKEETTEEIELIPVQGPHSPKNSVNGMIVLAGDNAQEMIHPNGEIILMAKEKQAR